MLAVKLKKNDISIANNVHLAKGFERIRGMIRNDWNNKDGLLIENTNSIHMFFMSFPLDIIFISSDNRIVTFYRSLKPWRMTAPKWSAVKVLELPSNSLPTDINQGDYLEFINV